MRVSAAVKFRQLMGELTAPAFGLVFRTRRGRGLPLHVGRRIWPTTFQWPDVIHHISWTAAIALTGGGAGVRVLEGTARDAASAEASMPVAW